MNKKTKSPSTNNTNLNINNNAVCYTRVSTQEQAEEGISLDAQREKLKAYCLMNSLNIIEIIKEEGVSGTKELYLRPGGSKIIELVAKNQIQHVVALKLDRLFRDAANALNQTKEWDKANIALHLVDLGGQTINTSTAMGRFFLNMMAGFAELERNLIAERTTQALGHMKSIRQVYSTTPYGFSVKKGKTENDPSFLVPNKDELKIIETIKRWHAKGNSLRAIASELNQRNVPTKKGGKWYASTVNYILNNDLYRKNENGQT